MNCQFKFLCALDLHETEAFALECSVKGLRCHFLSNARKVLGLESILLLLASPQSDSSSL